MQIDDKQAYGLISIRSRCRIFFDEKPYSVACLLLPPPTPHQSSQQPVLLIMRADPEPEQAIADGNGKHAILSSDTRRPVISNALELQRRVFRVGAEQPEILVREFAYLVW